MASAKSRLRDFGMTGILLCESLRQVEQRFDIALGYAPAENATNPTALYPQFEQSIRSDASAMSTHYEVFYCLEQSIRKVVAEAMEDAEGSDWWASGKVPEDVRKGVAERMQRELDAGVTRRSDEEIDYTDFGELSKLIEANWPAFEQTLRSKLAVKKVMTNLNLLRGPIAHCCPLQDDEVVRLGLAVRDWFRLFGGA